MYTSRDAAKDIKQKGPTSLCALCAAVSINIHTVCI
jgi:hypothetical protein